MAMGNLCIGIELLLKSFIASGNLSLVFTGLPQELRAYLVCAGEPAPKVNMRPHLMDLVSGRFKTIDFAQTVSQFFVFKPDLKDAHHAHLKLLSQFRNKSLHGLYPSIEMFAVERSAFTVIDIVSSLQKSGEVDLTLFCFEGQDTAFHRQFPSVQIDHVKRALDQATKKAKDRSTSRTSVDADGWDEYVGECPVCHNEALLEGNTDYGVEETAEGEFDDFLTFIAESLKCDACGLYLQDPEELRLAGVERSYERSTRMNQWYADNMMYP